MEIDLDEETDMNLLMIDSILELWQTKSLDTLVNHDFCEVKKKIKLRFDLLIESIRNLESSYVNHVQNLETDFKSKYTILKTEIDKLINLKNEYKTEKTKQIKDSNITDINVKYIEDLSEKIRSLAQNKIDFISNQKFIIEAHNIGKLINPSNKYDDKRLNTFIKSQTSALSSCFQYSNQINNTDVIVEDLNDNSNSNSNNSTISNNDLNQINQDYIRKININNLFTKPSNICFSNNRFTGALLIPEFKYSKLLTAPSSTAKSSSVLLDNNNEFALFSVANRNCLRLICIPEGRILRTYETFISSDSRQKQSLKEPRGMCWNYDRSLILICDSGNNRVIVLKPIFNKKTQISMHFSLEFEYLFEISDLTDLNADHSVNKTKLVDMNKLQYPASVCCNYDYTGDIYISDTFNNRIVCLNKDLNLIKSILYGGYNNPFSICLWKQKLIIADTYNNRILIVSIVDGEHEKTIPTVKLYNTNNNNNNNNILNEDDDDDDDDDDDSLGGYNRYKRKRVSSPSSTSNDDLMSPTISSSSSSIGSSEDENDDDDDDDSDNDDNRKKKSLIKKLKLKPGHFKRPYCVCVDANDRLYVLDWYKTDTKTSEETMRLSGRLQTFDLENDLQLLNFTKANNQLHLPNTMLILKNGSFLVCNVRHLTLFSQSDSYKYKVYKRKHKIKWRNVNNYSDDDDVIVLSHN